MSLRASSRSPQLQFTSRPLSKNRSLLPAMALGAPRDFSLDVRRNVAGFILDLCSRLRHGQPFKRGSVFAFQRSSSLVSVSLRRTRCFTFLGQPSAIVERSSDTTKALKMNIEDVELDTHPILRVFVCPLSAVSTDRSEGTCLGMILNRTLMLYVVGFGRGTPRPKPT